jgi:hypothetical protein
MNLEMMKELGPSAAVILVVAMFLGFGLKILPAINALTTVMNEVKGILLKINGK